MTIVAIRQLKNHLSEYVRRVRAGERVLITSHGQVVAELGTPRIGITDDPLAELSGLMEIGLADSVVRNDPSIYHQSDPARMSISSQELLDWLRGDR
jgi:antitoxin (DNA-binding transcriptional repressor) of toxin-antitoxin stability system